jgi:hypothetical protein
MPCNCSPNQYVPSLTSATMATTLSGPSMRAPPTDRTYSLRYRIVNDDLIAILNEALSIDCGFELEEDRKRQ